MVKAHPQALGGTIEEDRQENRQRATKYDEINHRHNLAGCQRHGNNGDQQFADHQVYRHRAGIVTRLALESKAAHEAVFIGLEKASEYFPPAAYRATLAQSPSQQ